MDELDRMTNPRHPDVRIENSIARAEVATLVMNRVTAQQYAAIDDTICDAIDHPEVFVDASAQLSTSERSEFAERAAVADLAVRLNLSETAVRARGDDARTARLRLPVLWRKFREGRVGPSNLHTAAALAGSLPENPATLAAFEDAVLEGAMTLAPARFTTRARVLRERIHQVSLVERHKAASLTRGVFLENEFDGMATLLVRGSADVIHRAYEGIDATARALAGVDDETRTLAQLRADVTADLLAERSVSGSPVRVSVAVTVPVLTLLGHTDDPGILDGYGPIDAESARRLAAHAPSFTRLLTHPISGGLLDIDRSGYRPPADLKRWKQVEDVTCRFAGCGRLARNSDLDHTVDYQHGGITRADNLMHLCRHHHRLKHMTKWRIERSSAGVPTWTSPTGHLREIDAPPF